MFRHKFLNIDLITFNITIMHFTNSFLENGLNLNDTKIIMDKVIFYYNLF